MPLSIVLVHGAWHSPAAWGSFPSLLEEAIGARVVAVALPSVHGAPAAYKAEDDALAIRALIEPELEEGRDVVTICHSYGGVPTADAVKGFLKSDRGAQAAVVGMIYFTSFVLAEGKALIGEQDAAGQSLVRYLGFSHCSSDVGSIGRGRAYRDLFHRTPPTCFTMGSKTRPKCKRSSTL